MSVCTFFQPSTWTLFSLLASVGILRLVWGAEREREREKERESERERELVALLIKRERERERERLVAGK